MDREWRSVQLGRGNASFHVLGRCWSCSYRVAVLRVGGWRRKACVSWQRFGPRRPCRGADFRRRVMHRLGLGRNDCVRCHVRCRRGCRRQRLYVVGTPGLWQAGAVTCDNRRGTIFEGCVRNEQQPDKNKTNNGEERENWHCRAPTVRSSTPCPLTKPRLDNRSSWTMGLRMRKLGLWRIVTRGQRRHRLTKLKGPR